MQEIPLNNYVVLKTEIRDEKVDGVYDIVENRYRTGLGVVQGISKDLLARYDKKVVAIEVGTKVRHELLLGMICDSESDNQTVIIEYNYLLSYFDKDGIEIPLNDKVILELIEEDHAVFESKVENQSSGVGRVLFVSEMIHKIISNKYSAVLSGGDVVRFKKDRFVELGSGKVLVSYNDLMCVIP